MGHALIAIQDARLQTFNTLTLQTQDDAYTLAYYLLGDERSAERATQAAFDQTFQQAKLQVDRFRFEVLRGVLECSQRILRLMPKPAARRMPACMANQDATFEKLLVLDENERYVVALVDVLELDYDEAGKVLGIPKKQVARLLAQARLNLSQADPARMPASLSFN